MNNDPEEEFVLTIEDLISGSYKEKISFLENISQEEKEFKFKSKIFQHYKDFIGEKDINASIQNTHKAIKTNAFPELFDVEVDNDKESLDPMLNPGKAASLYASLITMSVININNKRKGKKRKEKN